MGSWEWIVFAVGLSVSFVIAGIVILKAIARQTQAKTNERREALQKLNFRFTTKIDAEKSEQLDSVLSIQKLQGYSKKSLASGVYRDHPVQLLNLESIYFNGNIAVQIRQTVGLIPLNQSVPKMIITPKSIMCTSCKANAPSQIQNDCALLTIARSYWGAELQALPRMFLQVSRLCFPSGAVKRCHPIF